MARRLRGLFGEPIQFGPRKELHCRPGKASPEDGLSGRASLIAPKTRCRMGRTICVGLRRDPNGVASPHRFTVSQSQRRKSVYRTALAPVRWLRIDPLASRPAAPQPRLGLVTVCAYFVVGLDSVPKVAEYSNLGLRAAIPLGLPPRIGIFVSLIQTAPGEAWEPLGLSRVARRLSDGLLVSGQYQ